jgi:hypothetical protein
VIVPGVGLIACEVIRMLVDPLRERIAARLAPAPVAEGAASARDARPRWLMPTAAGASMLVAIMVVLASWGGNGAAIVDAMARRTVQTHASPAGAILRMAALAPASVSGGSLTMQSVQFVNWRNVGVESTSISPAQAPPAAIVQARLDLPAGGMREVSYQIFHDAAGARIVLQLSPLIRLAEANVYQGASPALGGDAGLSDGEAVFAALKSHIEATVSGAANVVEDFSGITFTTAPERPFLYVRGTEFADDGGAGANAALATASAALQRAGLTSYGEAIIVRLPGGSFLAGYAYEDFGETVEAATLGEAQLGRTPAGEALQLRYSGAETGASAAQQRLLAAAQSAGLQNGALVEQRSGGSATQIAAELDVAGEGALVPQVSRDYYLLVRGPASNLACVLGAIGSGVGYCDLNQGAH